MRCAWAFAIACLVAAAAVRPLHLPQRDPHSARIDVAPASLVVVARREAPNLPELRLPPHVLASAPAVTVPAVIALGHAWLASQPAATVAADTARARGPPMA